MNDHNINPDENENRTEQKNTYLIPSRRRLYKSPYNYILFGICGGISEYLNISPVLLRILFALTGIFGGWGIIAYAISFVLIPEHPSHRDRNILNRLLTQRAFGFLLIGVGVYYWLPPFGVFTYVSQINLSSSLFISGIITFLGLAILFRGIRKEPKPIDAPEKFIRPRGNRRLLGVCSGLALYLQTEINLIRILFLLFLFLTLGLSFVLYLFLGLITQSENAGEVVDA